MQNVHINKEPPSILIRRNKRSMSDSSSCVEAEKTSSKKSTKAQQTLELCVSEEKEGYTQALPLPSLLSSGDNDYDAQLMNLGEVDPKVVDRISTLRGNPCRHLLRMRVSLEEYPTFNLEKAVCNHGFFMMAPNKWDSITKTFSRPLTFGDGSSSVITLVRQSDVLEVYIDNTHRHIPHLSDLGAIMHQVKRMLRISPTDEQDLTEFQKLYPDAGVQGFGRLFRGPTLFEDIIKSVLLANTGWGNSLRMAQAMCELQCERTTGRDDGEISCTLKNFPTAKELARLDVELLTEKCKLGYRATTILSIAQKVENGCLQLDLADGRVSAHDVFHAELVKIKGVGEFIATNVSMCMGFYHKLPIDTETIQHVKKVHCVEEADKRSAPHIYDKFAPYQCLAYWFERVKVYESQLGKLSELPASSYGSATSGCCDDKRDSVEAPLRANKKRKQAPQTQKIQWKQKKNIARFYRRISKFDK